MSPEAQRIAIAEACGWALIENRDSIITGRRDWLSGLNPSPDKIEVVIEAFTGIERPPNESDYGWESLPNYLSDLNAMHEAEKVLDTPRKRICYAEELGRIWTGRKDRAIPDWGFIHDATAAQRAEAFLRTIGKWVEP